MSRSFKKNPYAKEWSKRPSKSHKWEKTHYNRKIRRIKGEIPDGCWYKKNVGLYSWDDWRYKERFTFSDYLRLQEETYKTIMNGTHWMCDPDCPIIFFDIWKESRMAAVVYYMEGDREYYFKRFVRK